MLHAYLDDSGSHDQAPVMVLAGYFGSERQWNRFNLKWRKALDAEGLKEFHANRFWARFKGACIPEYKDWDREKCMRFLATLLEIIVTHRIFPVSATVVMQDWTQLSVDERAVLTGAIYKDDGGQLVGVHHLIRYSSCHSYGA